jgi:hypothetical protein
VSPSAPCCPLCTAELCACGCGKPVAPSGNRRKDGLRFRKGHEGRTPKVSPPAAAAPSADEDAAAVEELREARRRVERSMASLREALAPYTNQQGGNS